MDKGKLIKAAKYVLIFLLLMAISILAILEWKSDVIVRKVMASVQHQLVDSLQYRDAGLDWFSHFPSAAIHITELKLGSGQNPLINGGDIAIVIRLWPLWHDEIIINRFQVSNADIHILQQEGRWSYEVLKKSGDQDDQSFNASIRQLVIDNTRLHYNDGKSLQFNLDITHAVLKGQLANHTFDTNIQLNASVNGLKMTSYQQDDLIPFQLEGQYSFDMNTGQQDFKEWKVTHEGIVLEGGGTVLRESDHDMVDLDISWKNGKPEILKKWLPQAMLKTWDHYNLSGENEGHARIQGRSSAHETPHVSCTSVLKDGVFESLAERETIKGISLDMMYDSGTEKPAKPSLLQIECKKSALFGSSLEGNIRVENLSRPVIDVKCKGSLPVILLNAMNIPALHFQQGTLDIDHFEINDFQPDHDSFTSFFNQAKGSCVAKDLKMTYLKNQIEIQDGKFQMDGVEKLELDVDRFSWNKATASSLQSVITATENGLMYSWSGKLCDGTIASSGSLSGLDLHPVLESEWKVRSIEMDQLLASFSNFDQSFITSENLDGRADIWAVSTIPFDEKWNIREKGIRVKSAIDIKDGQLKDMKTLEDFSAYVHLEDLKDIHFNQLHHYLKIEDGKVYLPVMFIQSTALNLSISGVHGFDQKILYFLKLNAGQVAANKLKKNESRKDFKPARKSGWINMYFVLEGTTSAVRYQQYRSAVISGFEQSSALKESLRNELVDLFGYEVYWIEPNEWEDIPEYE